MTKRTDQADAYAREAADSSRPITLTPNEREAISEVIGLLAACFSDGYGNATSILQALLQRSQ